MTELTFNLGVGLPVLQSPPANDGVLTRAETLSQQGKVEDALQEIAPFRSKSLAAKTLALRLEAQLQRRQAFLSLHLIAAFFPQNPDKPEFPEALQRLASSLQEQNKLRLAFASLDAKDQEEIRLKVGNQHLSEIFSISENHDREHFFASTLHFGIRLKQNNELDAAGGVLSFAANAKEPVPAELQKNAELELLAMQGKGGVGRRFEFLVGRFSREVSDYRTIAPMIGASIIGQMVNTAALGRFAGMSNGFLTRGWGARFLAGSLGFFAEASAFALSGRAFSDAPSGPLSEDFERAALTIGALRLFSFLGNQAFLKAHGFGELGVPTQLTSLTKITQVAFPQAAMFTGMLASHKLEEALKLRPHVDGATTLTDTLASMLSMEVGSHLGHSMLGRNFAKFQKEMGMRTDIFTAGGMTKSAEVKTAHNATVFSSALDNILGSFAIKNPLTWMLMGVDGGGGIGAKGKEPKKSPIKKLSGSPEEVAEFVFKNPTIENWRVAGDSLQEVGDPLGELIALTAESDNSSRYQKLSELKKRREEILKDLRENMEKKFEGLGIERAKFDFNSGLSLSLHSPKEDALKSLLASDDARFLFGLGFRELKTDLKSFLSLARRFKLLKIRQTPLQREDVQLIAGASNFASLTTLVLEEIVGAEAVRAIVDSPFLTNLTTLVLSGYDIREDGARAIAHSRNLKNLTTLDLKFSGIGTEGVQAIADSQFLTNLRTLEIGGSFIDGTGAQIIANSKNFMNLTKLGLMGGFGEESQIGWFGVRDIANSKILANLRTLDLSCNDIGSQGAQEIANSRSLANLTSLDLSINDIGGTGAQALSDSKTLANLRSLNLGGNGIGDVGARAIANSPIFANLRALYLEDNGIMDYGTHAIADSKVLIHLRKLKLMDPNIQDFEVLKKLSKNRPKKSVPVADLSTKMKEPRKDGNKGGPSGGLLSLAPLFGLGEIFNSDASNLGSSALIAGAGIAAAWLGYKALEKYGKPAWEGMKEWGREFGLKNPLTWMLMGVEGGGGGGAKGEVPKNSPVKKLSGSLDEIAEFVFADPSIENWRVAGDRLHELGDPLGELIALTPALDHSSQYQSPAEISKRRDEIFQNLREKLNEEYIGLGIEDVQFDFSAGLSLSLRSPKKEALKSLLASGYGRFLFGLRMKELGADLKSLLPLPQKLRLLEISPTNLLETDVQLIASLPNLTSLMTLELGNNCLRDAGAQILARSKTLINLKSLILWKNGIGNDGALAIARSKAFKNLTTLDLGTNNIEEGGARAIADSKTLKNLRTLNLEGSLILTAGARAIAYSETLANLTSLFLGGNDIGEAGARAIADSEAITNLRTLYLANNGIGAEGARAIAGSEALANLRTLYLANNGIGDEGARAIADSKTLIHLVKVNLGNYNIPDSEIIDRLRKNRSQKSLPGTELSKKGEEPRKDGNKRGPSGGLLSLAPLFGLGEIFNSDASNWGSSALIAGAGMAAAWLGYKALEKYGKSAWEGLKDWGREFALKNPLTWMLMGAEGMGGSTGEDKGALGKEVVFQRYLQDFRKNPENEAMRQVIMDQLLERGHPLGEMMALAQSKHATLEEKQKSFETKILNEIQTNLELKDPPKISFQWANGYIEGFRLPSPTVPTLNAIFNSEAGLFIHRAALGLASKDVLRDILELPRLQNLSDLTLNGIDDQDARVLANSPYLKNLSALVLNDYLRGKKSAYLGDGRFRYFHRCIHDEGFQALLESPYLKNLKKLDLSHSNISDAGVRFFLESLLPHLKNLDLALGGNISAPMRDAIENRLRENKERRNKGPAGSLGAFVGFSVGLSVLLGAETAHAATKVGEGLAQEAHLGISALMTAVTVLGIFGTLLGKGGKKNSPLSKVIRWAEWKNLSATGWLAKAGSEGALKQLMENAKAGSPKALEDLVTLASHDHVLSLAALVEVAQVNSKALEALNKILESEEVPSLESSSKNEVEKSPPDPDEKTSQEKEESTLEGPAGVKEIKAKRSEEISRLYESAKSEDFALRQLGKLAERNVEATRALGKLAQEGHPGAVPALSKLLENSSDPVPALFILMKLAREGNASALKTLSKHEKDEGDAFPLTMGSATGSIVQPESMGQNDAELPAVELVVKPKQKKVILEHLEEHLDNLENNDEQIRLHAVEMLKDAIDQNLKSESLVLVSWLDGLMESENWKIRHGAIQVLQHIPQHLKPEQRLPLVLKMEAMLEDPEPLVRIIALESLSFTCQDISSQDLRTRALNVAKIPELREPPENLRRSVENDQKESWMHVRRYALWVLRNMIKYGLESKDRLDNALKMVGLLNDPTEIQHIAVQTLNDSYASLAPQNLQALALKIETGLQDPKEEVRLASLTALKNILPHLEPRQRPSHLFKIRQRLLDPNEAVRRLAAQALK